MPKFRKKPVVIQAVQYHGFDNEEARKIWFDVIDSNDWVDRAYDEDVLVNAGKPGGRVYLLIQTLEGQMHPEPGDWIIRGVKGEIYSCKPDIFAATYDRVEEGG